MAGHGELEQEQWKTLRWFQINWRKYCGNHLVVFRVSRDIYKNDWDLLFRNHMFACMSAHHRRVEHPQDILWLSSFLPIGLLPLVFELPMLDTLLITWNLKHPSINGCCSWMTPNNYCTMVQIYVKALVRPFPTEKCCDSASPLLLVYWECPFSGSGWWTPAGECRENPASA